MPLHCYPQMHAELEQLPCAAGPFCDKPISMMLNLSNASPEVVRAMAEEDAAEGRLSQEHVSVMAHDVWAVGCLLGQLVIGSSFFKVLKSCPADQRAASVAQQHRQWVCLLWLELLYCAMTAVWRRQAGYNHQNVMFIMQCWSLRPSAAVELGSMGKQSARLKSLAAFAAGK